MKSLISLLLTHVPRSKTAILAAICLAAAASGAAVGLMGTSSWLLSRAAEMPPLMYLNVAVVGVRFFGISRGCFRYVERLASHQIALRMQSALRLHVYDKLAQTTLIGQRQGDLLARVVIDVEAIMDLVVRVIVPSCSASLVITGTTLILARFSVLNALILLATALLSGLVIPILAQRLSERADAAASPLRGSYAGLVHEFNHAAVDLVAYAAHDQMLQRLQATEANLRQAENKAAWVRGLASATQLLAAAIAVGAALIIGGQAVATNDLKPRLLAVLVLVPLALHEVLADLSQAAQTLTKARSALARISDVVALPSIGSGDQQLVAPPAGVIPVVQLHNVALGWPAGPVLTSGMSWQIATGDRLAVTGASGSGKTTLAATIMGLIPPKTGAIVVQGRVGYLAQDAHIFATTLLENVRIGNPHASDAEIITALAKSGLAHLDPHREVGERGASLSGGEARRLALARLLVGDFEIWVLDEPTEHLDSETARKLMTDVWSAAGEAPVVVLTHDGYLQAQCSKNVHMR